MVLSPDGIFIEARPVQSISSKAVTEINAALFELLSKEPPAAGEKDLNDPEAEFESQPVMLEFLHLKLWSEFEKKALMYTLHRKGEMLAVHKTGRGADSMWSLAASETREFNLDSADLLTEACRQISIALSQEPPPSAETKAPLLLGLPGPKSEPGKDTGACGNEPES